MQKGKQSSHFWKREPSYSKENSVPALVQPRADLALQRTGVPA